MKISVSGTPGTGKTAVSKKVAETMDLEYVSVNELARDENCIEARDERRETDVVDVDCLKKQADGLEDCVLDGHLSHFLNSDHVFVLRCEPGELEERLEEKGWDRPKIRENVDAEILGTIAGESREENDGVYDIDTTDREPQEVVDIVSDIVRGKIKKEEYKQKINWM